MERLDWQQLDDAAGVPRWRARPPARIRPAGAGARPDQCGAPRWRCALRACAREFEHAELDSLQVSAAEFAAAESQLAPEALRALRIAIENVTQFHLAQRPQELSLETQPGVRCEQLVRPIQAVGLYVPAGSAPLRQRQSCWRCPRASRVAAAGAMHSARRDGTADPAVLVVARWCGLDSVFKVGGAQAIAAMAYGTERHPSGREDLWSRERWVSAAKQLVATDPMGAAMDLPAGPSEVMVIADETADASFVALDLLAQASMIRRRRPCS